MDGYIVENNDELTSKEIHKEQDHKILLHMKVKFRSLNEINLNKLFGKLKISYAYNDGWWPHET